MPGQIIAAPSIGHYTHESRELKIVSVKSTAIAIEQVKAGEIVFNTCNERSPCLNKKSCTNWRVGQ